MQESQMLWPSSGASKLTAGQVIEQLQQELLELRASKLRLTEKQAICISAYTGVLLCPLPVLLADISEKAKRPISVEELQLSILEVRNLYAADFENLIPLTYLKVH